MLWFIPPFFPLDATSLFAIGNTTGLITVSGDLDREGVPGEQVQLQIVVSRRAALERGMFLFLPLPEALVCLSCSHPQAREKNLNIYHQVAQVSTTVNIQVTDINDHTPEFYLCVSPPCNFTGPPESNFSGQIEEHASARTPVVGLHIVAYDPDKVCISEPFSELCVRVGHKS